MISPEELAFYESNKAKLIEALDNRAKVIDSRNSKQLVGLVNQGATCYLNSLLQCLFNDRQFRNALYSSTVNKPIIKSIQELFSSMQLSDASAISTRDIVLAFGWSKSQVFEQHDVHELFSVLIDALCQASTELNSSLLALFQGTSKDVLECPACNNKRECGSTFLNLSLDLPDNLESHEAAESISSIKKCVYLEDILRSYVTPEILDVDNKWECSSCSQRVQATKSQIFDQLPARLLVHLKRFRFDPTTRRRRKLSAPVLFPLTINAYDLLKSPVADGQKPLYRLTAILMHTGTAMGGHYRAYVRSADTAPACWLDCNDASVTMVPHEEEESLFWCSGGYAQAKAAMDVNDPTRRFFLYESAYMLIYSKIDDSPAAQTVVAVPRSLAEDVEASNREMQFLRRLLAVHKQMVEVIVYFSARSKKDNGALISGDVGAEEEEKYNRSGVEKQSIQFLETATLEEVLFKVFNIFVASRGSNGNRSPRGTPTLLLSRLRRYNDATNRVGETYGGREKLALKDLGLGGSSAVMLLERRAESDPPFVEFNPREMQIRLSPWLGEEVGEKQNSEAQEVAISVPGEDLATVGALREEAYKALGLARTSKKVVLILSTDRTLVELLDDGKLLKRDHGVWPGDEIVVDVVSPETEDGSSPAMVALKNRRKAVRIFFNDPTEVHASESGGGSSAGVVYGGITYSHSLETTLDNTLLEVKKSMSAALSLPVDSFHVRRSAQATQIKDESKTLHSLSVIDQSTLHLQSGAGCALGEHMLQFELDADSPTDMSEAAPASDLIVLSELRVREKHTILQLKQQILENWDSLTAKARAVAGAVVPPTPASANHFRLRDGKNVQASGPLRNDRILSRCLLQIADGRRVIVQVLPHPEVIGQDDVVLSVRIASYDTKVLTRVIDFPVPRTSSVLVLYGMLLARFPQLNEEPPAGTADVGSGGVEDDAEAGHDAADSGAADGAGEGDLPSSGNTPPPPQCKVMALAKGFISGPPLTLKSALKLKWNDPIVLRNSDSPIDRPPLNLRDGSVVVIRGIADFERARARAGAAAKARKESEGARVVSVGAGAAAVRAKSASNRPGSRAKFSAQSSLPPVKERGLKINVGEEGAPPPPQPSPEKAMSIK